jgi:hypothetical protein
MYLWQFSEQKEQRDCDEHAGGAVGALRVAFASSASGAAALFAGRSNLNLSNTHTARARIEAVNNEKERNERSTWKMQHGRLNCWIMENASAR